MFGNLGFGELMVMLLIVLVLFGAKRIPEISGAFGKGIREFKKNMNDVEGSLTNASESRTFDAPRPVPRDVAQDDDSRPEPKRLL